MPAENRRPAERNYAFEQQLTNAIAQRRRIRFRYQYDVHYRVFDPYILFKDNEGRHIIGGVRLKDESKPMKKPAPCKYEVGLITAIEVSDNNFDVDSRFNNILSKYANLDVLSTVEH